MASPLFTDSEWTFQSLDRVFKAIEDIAVNELKLQVYPNQVEIISTEQMASIAVDMAVQRYSEYAGK